MMKKLLAILICLLLTLCIAISCEYSGKDDGRGPTETEETGDGEGRDADGAKDGKQGNYGTPVKPIENGGTFN